MKKYLIVGIVLLMSVSFVLANDCGELGEGCCEGTSYWGPFGVGVYVPNGFINDTLEHPNICCDGRWKKSDSCEPGPILCDHRPIPCDFSVGCEYDHNADGEMNDYDITLFLQNLGRNMWNNPCFEEPSGTGCYGDYDYDGDVDSYDTSIFIWVMNNEWLAGCTYSHAVPTYEYTECGFSITHHYYSYCNQPPYDECGQPIGEKAWVLAGSLTEDCLPLPYPSWYYN